MTIWTDMLGDLYGSEIATTATLEPNNGAAEFEITILDKSEGLEIEDVQTGLHSIRPVIFIRMSDLVAQGLDRNALDGGSITINSRSWRLSSHQLRPTPDGETAGQVMIFLQDGAL